MQLASSTEPQDAAEDLYQDVISQFPLLNGFAHLLFGFDLPSELSRDVVVQALTHAVDEVVLQVPWLSGRVQHIPGQEGCSGTYVPAPWPNGNESGHIVIIKECDELIEPMTAIVRTNAPIAKLDGDILTPYPGLPRPHGIEGPVPIVRVQANFIRQGLILCVSTHHNIMDATGLLQFVRLVATVLNGEEIARSDIDQANRDRSRVIPLFPRGESMMDCSHFRRPHDFAMGTFISPPTWCLFHLPLTALSLLRKLATSEANTIRPSSGDGMLSENDMICAFVWQRISAMRLARSSDRGAAQKMVKFGRAIDARMAMGVPSAYMGHMIFHASTWLHLGHVVSSPLSTIAQALRRDLNAVNNAWAVRSFVSFIAREADKSKLMYGGKFDPTVDLIATSTTIGMGDAKEGGSSLQHFGPLLGKLRFIRRPNTTPLAGSVTITPAERGNIPVVLCMPKEELDALQGDASWRRYFKRLG